MAHTWFAVTLSIMIFSLPGHAQSREIAASVGWQQGGEIEVAGERGDLDGSNAFALTLSFPRGELAMLDFVVSRQATTARDRGPFGELSIDVEVHYLQLGGRVLFRRNERFEPYIGLTVGGTLFTFDGSDATARFSFSAGAGTDLHLSRSTALRLDTRYYTTLASAGGELSCDSLGTCIAFGEGSTFGQWNVSTGFVYRF